jgi:peptidyl-prolyl cis-trans isomerase B (cyclophilin B)
LSKRRRVAPRSPESQARRAERGRRQAGQGTGRSGGRSWLPLALGGVAIVVTLLVVAAVMGWLPTGTPGQPDPDATATPLANPPAQPAGDGTRVTIETELGSIVMEIHAQSSPVAADNFVSLAESGFYDGVVFHRIVPGFVIQGGDPEGTGRGGPGYTIADEPVVGEYVRGTVAMARTPAPNSQGSQFFIVLDDAVQFQLDKAGGYAIFGQVVEGMDVVDQIAAGPASQQMALEPVAMTRVTVQRP